MRRGAALLCIVVSAACTTIPDAPPISPSVGYWQGRFSLTLLSPSGKDSEATGEERVQGRFALRREPNRMELALFSPFGQQLANAMSDETGASLTTSKGAHYSARDTDSLIEQALGWRLPVDAMPDWLTGKGLPADDAWAVSNQWRVRVEQRDALGTPTRLAGRWPANDNTDQRRLKLFIIVDPKKK